MGQGGGGEGAVKVVDGPIFNLFGVVGKARLHDGAVLSLFQRDDVGGRGEVGSSQWATARAGLLEGDAAVEQNRAGVGGDIAAD